jgi:hypothetical protein
MLITRVYPVGDIIGYEHAGYMYYDYDSLIDTVQSTLQPTSWDVVGGCGSIAPADFQNVEAIVVQQTYHVHRGIAKLLADLRKASSGPKSE